MTNYRWIRTLPDGRTVEHLDTTFVSFDGAILTLTEHVLMDGALHSMDVDIPTDSMRPEHVAWANRVSGRE